MLTNSAWVTLQSVFGIKITDSRVLIGRMLEKADHQRGVFCLLEQEPLEVGKIENDFYLMRSPTSVAANRARSPWLKSRPCGSTKQARPSLTRCCGAFHANARAACRSGSGKLASRTQITSGRRVSVSLFHGGLPTTKL